MKGVIRQGDPTSHGGKVVGASGPGAVMGRAVARRGDACACPQRGHSNCVIAEGDPNVLLDGVPVAFEGHRTSCGATLISTETAAGRS
ncbi:PAAR domain-containing protein [Zoogloea sp.]|uniref:PAAR domain-containing protein n=1 Tax=Zoogloea sp. TaxID=49181 RepID=UPI0035AE5138